jgi:hypothetical protein
MVVRAWYDGGTKVEESSCAIVHMILKKNTHPIERRDSDVAGSLEDALQVLVLDVLVGYIFVGLDCYQKLYGEAGNCARRRVSLVQLLRLCAHRGREKFCWTRVLW